MHSSTIIFFLEGGVIKKKESRLSVRPGGHPRHFVDMIRGLFWVGRLKSPRASLAGLGVVDSRYPPTFLFAGWQHEGVGEETIVRISVVVLRVASRQEKLRVL